MRYCCGDENRRKRISEPGAPNGIDYVEVQKVSRDGIVALDITFFKSFDLAAMKEAEFQIESDEPLTSVLISVPHDQYSTFSRIVHLPMALVPGATRYTLRLVSSKAAAWPPQGFDPVLCTVNFFIPAAAIDLEDCLIRPTPSSAPSFEPEINYLAKDYASFRRLMLDRMALLLPAWKERNPTDQGVALIELLAYVADQLSYQQDAVATEAYLGTARRRVSVRRHARLVDYRMDEGCNARAWVCIKVKAGCDDGEGVSLPRCGSDGRPLRPLRFLTSCPGLPSVIAGESEDTYRQFNPTIFEILEGWCKDTASSDAMRDEPIMLYAKHNEIPLYNWCLGNGCLPAGSTGATLEGHLPNLKKGDVLILQPSSENENSIDATPVDATLRHAVRLTRVVSDWFEVTTETIATLQEYGVPRDLATQLAAIAGRKFFGVEALLQAAAEIIGNEMLNAPLWEDTHGLYGQYYEYEAAPEDFDIDTRRFGRVDPVIDFSWATKPHPNVRQERFAVRWTGMLEAPGLGEYKFYLGADDGGRLWIGDKLVVDTDKKSVGAYTFATGAAYALRLEYWQLEFDASVKLEWETSGLLRQIIPSIRFRFVNDSGSQEPGLLGEYYEFEGLPAFEPEKRKAERIDPLIDFVWSRKPDQTIKANQFSVRWKGLLKPKVTGLHSFFALSDDGVRLWIAGQRIIDDWTDHAQTWNEGECELSAEREYEITIEYYQREFEALIRLEWEAPGLPREVIPSNQLRPPRERTIADRLLKFAQRTPLTDPLFSSSVEITEIEWPAEDALPFPLQLGAGDSGGAALAVARGNVVLVDHGCTQKAETMRAVSGRFRPRLSSGPLTQAAPQPDPNAPATAALSWDMSAAAPEVEVGECSQDALGDIPVNKIFGAKWECRRDLLDSDLQTKAFVVEVADDGVPGLRFGDGTHGLRPPPGLNFRVCYRIGTGTAGNVGAGALQHIVADDATAKPIESIIESIENPLPAAGGRDPESIEDVRQRAPTAFRVQRRCVTAEDYSVAIQCHPLVRRAAAGFRWTGSWRTLFIVVERIDRKPLSQDFVKEILDFLETGVLAGRSVGGGRLAGHDIEVEAPRYVPLAIEMGVGTKSDHIKRQVIDALRNRFSNRIDTEGRRGFFHPDNFGFGQPVYLSPIYAAAQRIPGVEWAEIKRFERKDNAVSGLDTGMLTMGRLEIAHLDAEVVIDAQGGK